MKNELKSLNKTIQEIFSFIDTGKKSEKINFEFENLNDHLNEIIENQNSEEATSNTSYLNLIVEISKKLNELKDANKLFGNIDAKIYYYALENLMSKLS